MQVVTQNFDGENYAFPVHWQSIGNLYTQFGPLNIQFVPFFYCQIPGS